MDQSDSDEASTLASFSPQVKVDETFKSDGSTAKVGTGKEPVSTNTIRLNHLNFTSSNHSFFGSTKLSNASKTIPGSSSASRQGASTSRIHDEVQGSSSALPASSNQYSEKEISGFKDTIKMLEGIVESHERNKGLECFE